VKQAPDNRATQGSASSVEPKKVLLVEDSRAIASIRKASIEALDAIECMVATSHAEAARLLQAHRDEFLVAVLDLNLPDAPDGEVIDLVQPAGIPIIVLTANVDAARRAAMFERGVADYVVKDSLVGIEYVARLVNRLARNGSTRVLVVDDSRAFRQYLCGLLHQHGYATLDAADGVQGLEALCANPDVRLVITDYNMPRMDGLAMVAEMRKLRSHDDLAIIGVSDMAKQGILARFLKGGATDYLNKPFCVEEFYCRVDQNIDMLRVVQRARDAANRDFLTGLHNRRYFFEHAERLHRQAVSGELSILVAMIDADHFKRINDTFGHQVGDEALVAIAAVLREEVEGKGVVARFGGEEFVCLRILDPQLRPAECLERIRRRIAGIDLSAGADAVPISVSIGATSEPLGDIDQMLARADEAVYQAKRAGRNRVVIA
jgi:diguanylate cyclase (GGDEF)-like protein